MPLFGQGACLKVSVDKETNQIGDVLPLYPLTEIKLDEGENLYELVSGDTMNIKIGKANARYRILFLYFMRIEANESVNSSKK